MVLVADNAPSDFSSFLVWALSLVCGALAALVGGLLNWGKGYLEATEVKYENRLKAMSDEAKADRMEDQKNFLTALAARDVTIQAQTLALQALTKTVVDHDNRMTDKHSIESETIARLAGEAAVSEYIRKTNGS